MTWTQTRRYEKRICWTATAPNGFCYRLRATQTGMHALLELYRTDRGGAVADRRDGWKEVVVVPDGDLDKVKNIALTWAALRVGA